MEDQSSIVSSQINAWMVVNYPSYQRYISKDPHVAHTALLQWQITRRYRGARLMRSNKTYCRALTHMSRDTTVSVVILTPLYRFYDYYLLGTEHSWPDHCPHHNYTIEKTRIKKSLCDGISWQRDTFIYIKNES